MDFDTTGWEIAGASGLQVTVGTPIARIEVGGAHVVMPIKHLAENRVVKLEGPGAGILGGFSVSVPGINASGGFFPGMSLETQLIGASVDAFAYNVSVS